MLCSLSRCNCLSSTQRVYSMSQSVESATLHRSEHTQKISTTGCTARSHLPGHTAALRWSELDMTQASPASHACWRAAQRLDQLQQACCGATGLASGAACPLELPAQPCLQGSKLALQRGDLAHKRSVRTALLRPRTR